MNKFLKEFKDKGYFYQCTDENGLSDLLNKKSIHAYIGFDSTAPSLHVGSLLQIMCLRLLQKHGHRPIILLGGGTTRIGDPSGKEQTRKILSEKQIEKNILNIKKVFKIFLKTNKPSLKPIFVNNFKWLGKLNYINFLREIGKHFTINKMLSFDSVKLRLDREQSLSIVNGIDLIKKHASKQVFGLTTPLITIASGAKMGKTESGAVWLDANYFSPYDYWQFWRNTDDADVLKFLKMFTDLDVEKIHEIKDSNINELKILLANEATKMLHGEKSANDSEKTAKDTFEKGLLGKNLPTIKMSKKSIVEGINILDLIIISKLLKSKSEARRAIKNNGIKVNGIVIINEKLKIDQSYFHSNSCKLSFGKKNHIAIKTY